MLAAARAPGMAIPAEADTAFREGNDRVRRTMAEHADIAWKCPATVLQPSDLQELAAPVLAQPAGDPWRDAPALMTEEADIGLHPTSQIRDGIAEDGVGNAQTLEDVDHLGDAGQHDQDIEQSGIDTEDVIQRRPLLLPGLDKGCIVLNAVPAIMEEGERGAIPAHSRGELGQRRDHLIRELDGPCLAGDETLIQGRLGFRHAGTHGLVPTRAQGLSALGKSQLLGNGREAHLGQ